MGISGLMTGAGRIVTKASKQIGLKIKSAIRPAPKALTTDLSAPREQLLLLKEVINLKNPLQTIPEDKEFIPQSEPISVDNKPKIHSKKILHKHKSLPLQECINDIRLKNQKIVKRKILLAIEKNEQNRFTTKT